MRYSRLGCESPIHQITISPAQAQEKKVNYGPTVSSGNDYKISGTLIPGRNYIGSLNYRYGFQGQFAEKDAETNKNSFELRSWDGLLGRWLTKDPYKQHHSSYMGMGNNPINSVDPNGGWDDWYVNEAGTSVIWKNTDANYLNINGECFNRVGDTYTWSTILSDGTEAFYLGGLDGSSTMLNVIGQGAETVKFSHLGFEFIMNNADFRFYKTMNAISALGSVNYGDYNVSSDAMRRALRQFADANNLNIIVTSGNRSAERNKKVGGANASRHISGDAVDIAVSGMSNLDLSRMAHRSGLFNTTIYYPNINATGALRPHVHLDMNPEHNNSFLIYSPIITNGVAGKARYLPFK